MFSLVEHLDHIPFAAALYVVADLIGFTPAEPAWIRQARDRAPNQTVAERWQNRRKPWRGSATWRYLSDARGILEPVLRQAIASDVLREGPQGSMWAAHRDRSGTITGWEERGPQWRGFATGGAKVLFRLGPADASRLCVTEAAIDALSLAALEELRADTLYLSTGGGWSPATFESLLDLTVCARAHLVAATDNDDQGETYADRLARLAADTGCSFERIRPSAGDWNKDLRGSNR